jgi:hypothetical protein
MNAISVRMEDAAHTNIFDDMIVPDIGIDSKTSRVRQKSNMAAGQPGAGTGVLSERAELELTMRLSTREAPIYQTRTLAAGAELSDRLTWQASRISIELAQMSRPRGRDPCTTPSHSKPKIQQGLMSWHS